MSDTGTRDELARARSWLFVPGDRPERFAKAAASGADVVVLDLEDAVAPEAKPAARAAVARWLADGNTAAVRINAVTTQWYAADVEAVTGSAAAVMVPKAENPDDWGALGTTPVIALIETAAGVAAARRLLDTSRVVRAALGTIDLALQLGVDPDDEQAMLWARGALVLASAVAEVAAPIDGATTALDDAARLAADVARARRLGLTGKLCIHPRQVPVVHDGFRPGEDELAWARRIVAASGSGASAVDGEMVDAPVLARAHRMLAHSAH